MSWQLSMILTLCAPFAFGLAVMGILKLWQICAKHRAERIRARKIALYGLNPFRGVRAYDDQH